MSKEYEEFKESNKLNDDDVICLTPKGYLSYLIKNYENIDTIWNKLSQFVDNQADKNGYGVGCPTLVFIDGGYCTTMVASNNEITDSE